MFYKYPNEANIVYNASLQHKGNAFLKEILDDYFSPDKKWRFFKLLISKSVNLSQ